MNQELLSRYIYGLKRRIERFEEDLENARAGDDRAKENIRRNAHDLRGSGGTYGFPQITQRAGEVEDADDSKLLHQADNFKHELQTIVERSPLVTTAR